MNEDKFVWVCLACGHCGQVQMVDYSVSVDEYLEYVHKVMKEIIASHTAHNHDHLCGTTEIRVYADSDHFTSIDPHKPVDQQ